MEVNEGLTPEGTSGRRVPAVAFKTEFYGFLLH